MEKINIIKDSVMKAKFNFKLMNSLGVLPDEQFKVAYFILNTIAMEPTDRVKIYRDVLADLTNKSTKTIGRITDKLNELKIIKKDVVSDSRKKYNFYSVHPEIESWVSQNSEEIESWVSQNSEESGHRCPETTLKVDTDVPFNKIYNNNNNYKNNNNNKNNNTIQNIQVKDTNIEIPIQTETSKTTNNSYFEEFTEIVKKRLVGADDVELLEKRAELSGELSKKKYQIGQSLYSRCSSYLNRKYDEAIASV